MRIYILFAVLTLFIASPAIAKKTATETKKEPQKKEQTYKKRFELPCLPKWAKRNEYNISRQRCK